MTTVSPVVSVDAVDPRWLTDVLTAGGAVPPGARVVEVDREVCGTGQLADSYRFALRYDPPDAGPRTVVGKFASEDAVSRDFGQRSGYYKHEVRFYQEVAPALGASTSIPTPLHAALADNETDFVLLMEDLAPARVVDQLVGCTADEAAAVVGQLAALHAGTWDRRELAVRDWLGGTVASFLHVTDTFAETIGTFEQRFGDLIPADQVAEAARLTGHLERWKAVLSRQVCLWHSDLRADNLLFGARAGQVPVALLDWQGVGYGPGTLDLAYFLGTSLPVPVRRDHERELVATYHRELVGRGVAGYSAARCWHDYRVGALHPLQVGVFGLGAVKRNARGDAMWRNWIERACAQVRELDSYSALTAPAPD